MSNPDVQRQEALRGTAEAIAREAFIEAKAYKARVKELEDGLRKVVKELNLMAEARFIMAGSPSGLYSADRAVGRALLIAAREVEKLLAKEETDGSG